MPVAYHRPVSSRLTIITRYISLDRWAMHAETIRKYKLGFRCLYPFCIMAYLLTWLVLITVTTGMCLINAYVLVKVRLFLLIEKEGSRWIRIFLFPSVSSLRRHFSTNYLKIFFKFLIADFTDFATI